MKVVKRKKFHPAKKKKTVNIVCSTFTVCKRNTSPKKKKCPARHKRKRTRSHCINVCKIKKPVKVVSKDFDIRNLTPTRDKVEIFGTDGDQLKAIRTDEIGRLEVVPAPSVNTIFIEEKFLNFNVTDQFTPLPQQDTSTKTMTSYAVINRGENSAIIRTEISPNSIDFVIDQEDIVPPNAMRVFVPNRFLKWTRLLVCTEEAGSTTFLDVYFQSQTMAS